MFRPELLRKRTVVSLNVGVGIRTVGRGKERHDVAVQQKLEEPSDHGDVANRPAEGRGIVDTHHLRDRMIDPEAAELIDRFLHGFG